MVKTVFCFFVFFSLRSGAVFSSQVSLDSASLDQTASRSVILNTAGLKLSSFSQGTKKESLSRERFLFAEDDSVFDESDLIDIESGNEADLQNEDELLDKEFNDIEEDQSETNFDPKDFEELEEDLKNEEGLVTDEEGEEFNSLDYEIISDKPGYEILTDEELEKEFEDKGEFEDLPENEESQDFEDETDFGGDDISEEGDREDQMEPEDLSEEGDIKSNLEGLEAEEGLSEDFIGETEEEEEPVQEEEPVEEGFLGEEEPLLEEEPIEDNFIEDSVEEDSSFGGESVIEESFESADLDTDSSSLNLITNIRYLIESNQIVIDASEIPTYEERVNEENNQLIIEILQAKLAKNLNWPYIMRDFDTDFGLLKADQKDSTTVRVIIQLKPSAPIPPVTLTEEGRILIGEERQKSDESDAADTDGIDGALDLSTQALPQKTLKDLYFGDIDFVGEPLSFHVIDADVRQVLRFISEESGMNMVIDEAVQGTVTLKLEDVPWDQALYTIFKVNSLGYLRDGNIITILPLQKIQEQTTQLKAISDRQRGLSPIETKIIPIMYGKAEDIEAKVNPFSTPAVSGLTQGGQIIVHEESNSLIVMDNAEAIQKIESLAKFLDYPAQQVMIESKIVEVSKSFARNFGLNWSLSGDLPVRITASGFMDFLTTAFNNIGANWSIPNKGRGPNSFNISGLPFIGNVEATLNLAENNGIARVLNTTKILVKSGKSASIDKNTPIQVRSSLTENLQSGVENDRITTTFNQQDVKLNSSVTPTVTSSGSISMEVSVTLSDPGPGGEQGATVITRNASTEIISKSGQTMVLSGIYQKSENRGWEGTPLLRKIPLLGFLFNNSNFSSSESEMLMFITPTLVEN